jgi:hypothetical protein
VRTDPGAVAVEAALVLAVVLVAALGLVDVASLGTRQLALERSASAMARLARSGVAEASDLDLLALLVDASDTAVGEPGGFAVRRVVIYRASVGQGSLPLACDLYPETDAATGIDGSCNVYGPAHLETLARGGAAPKGCTTGSWEAAWCPQQRRRQAGSADLIGVFIEAHHRPPARLLTPTGGRRVTASAVVAADADADADAS